MSGTFFPQGWGGTGTGGGDFQGFSSGYQPGGAGAPSGGFQLGWNAPTMQMGMSALNTAGNLWGAWQANKLAKDQLNFTKMITNTNLNNQIKSYNTALEDRSRSRAAVESQTSAQAQAYVDRNRMSRS